MLLISNPSTPVLITTIPISIYGGLVNSVYVKMVLAAAIEASSKQIMKGCCINTSTYAEIAVRTALPDMVTFS
jgi:hypothetical protein